MELHEYLIEYVGGLISELGIPFLLSLVIDVPDGAEILTESAFRPFEIYVNSTKCPYPIIPSSKKNDTPFEMAVSIAHVVYENREFLVTSGVSQKIFDHWRENDEGGIISHWVIQDFHLLLIEAVRKGISFLWVERAINSVDLEEIKTGMPLNPEEFFEKVIFTTDVITLGALLPEDFYQRLITEKSDQDEVKNSITLIFALLQEGFFHESGVNLPQIKLSVDTSLDAGWIRIQINNLRFPPIQCITQNQLCVNESGDRFSLLRIPFTPIFNPMKQVWFSVIPKTAEFETACKSADLVTYDEEGWMGLLIGNFVRKNLPLFLPREMVEFQLWQLSKQFSHLVETFVNFFPIFQLTVILRELLAERISIRNLKLILDILLELHVIRNLSGNSQIPATIWAQFLRQELRSQITSQLASEDKLIAILVDKDWEKKIQEFDSLPEPLHDALIEAIQLQLGPNPPAPPPVILTSEHVRRKVVRTIERDFPSISVLSYGEIWEKCEVHPIGRINFPAKLKTQVALTK